MDYSKMSDFEINKLVAVATGARVTESVGFVNTGENISGHYQEPVLLREVTNNRRHWKQYDPCNNAADAWPIIAENKISIMWMTEEKQWCAWANGELQEGCWEWKYCPDDYSHDDNPLRAAMIVFLMMQESSNADV